MGRALIVSAGASSNEYIAARLAEMGYSRPVILPSGAEARRRMPDADFDLIVVNAPLPDEFGHELCMDAVASTDAGVVFLVKAAQAEQLLAPLNGIMKSTSSSSWWNTSMISARMASHTADCASAARRASSMRSTLRGRACPSPLPPGTGEKRWVVWVASVCSVASSSSLSSSNRLAVRYRQSHAFFSS